jgi:hypothetical protein
MIKNIFFNGALWILNILIVFLQKSGPGLIHFLMTAMEFRLPIGDTDLPIGYYNNNDPSHPTSQNV